MLHCTSEEISVHIIKREIWYSKIFSPNFFLCLQADSCFLSNFTSYLFKIGNTCRKRNSHKNTKQNFSVSKEIFATLFKNTQIADEHPGI